MKRRMHRRGWSLLVVLAALTVVFSLSALAAGGESPDAAAAYATSSGGSASSSGTTTTDPTPSGSGAITTIQNIGCQAHDDEEEQTGISIGKESTTMAVGKKVLVSVSVFPTGTKQDVVWNVKDPKVISAVKWTKPADDDAAASGSSSKEKVGGSPQYATVTALYPGQTTIWAHDPDNEKKTSETYQITVSGLLLKVLTPEEQDVTNSTVSVMKDESVTISPTPYGDAVSNTSFGDAQVKRTWEWSSDNAQIAYVDRDSGVVTGAGEGTCTITCEASDGSYKASCKVQVTRDTSSTVRRSLSDGVLRFSRIETELRSLCRSKTGHDLVYVTNLRVPTEQGTLYYKYESESDTGFGVGATDQYYVDNSDNRQLDEILFMPRGGYIGDAVIQYTAYNGSTSFAGEIVVPVDQGDLEETALSYTSQDGKAIHFKGQDFVDYCRATRSRGLQSVVFSLPSSSRGQLYYNYDPSNAAESTVVSGTRYYPNQSPRIDNLAFVPNDGYAGTFNLSYRAYDATGSSFTGNVQITVIRAGGSSTVNSGRIEYSTRPGKRVYFDAGDFSDLSYDETNRQLNYVRFSLPSSSRGRLYYDGDTRVSSSTNYYYSGSSSSRRLLDDVSFLPEDDFTGTVNIGFTGWSTQGVRFEGTVRITVTNTGSGNSGSSGGSTASTGTSIVYMTSGEAVAFQYSDLTSACAGKTKGVVNRVQFDLPDASMGRLYANYISPAKSVLCSSSQEYSVTSLSPISFVPKAGFYGTAYISYTGYDQLGGKCTGTIRVNVAPSNSSAYFYDMDSASWAVQSVDFLRRYGIVNGKTYTTYGPNLTLTRGEYLLMLSRTFQFQLDGTESFPDVPRGSYYAAAIAAAKKAGYISGDKDGRFYPENPITRQDAAVILYRCLRTQSGSTGTGKAVQPGNIADLSIFGDYRAVSGYATEGLGALVREGIFQGDSYGFLRPESTLTRAEMAAILHRALTR